MRVVTTRCPPARVGERAADDAEFVGLGAAGGKHDPVGAHPEGRVDGCPGCGEFAGSPLPRRVHAGGVGPAGVPDPQHLGAGLGAQRRGDGVEVDHLAHLVEPEVDRARAVGEAADGDDVDARGGDGGDSVEGDVAASLGGRATVDKRDGAAQLVGGEVVEHDAVDAPLRERH